MAGLIGKVAGFNRKGRRQENQFSLVEETLRPGDTLGLGVELVVADGLPLGLLLGILDLLGLLVDVSAVNLLGFGVGGTKVVGSVVELAVPAAISWQVTPSMADFALWKVLDDVEELYELIAGALVDVGELVDDRGLLLDDPIDDLIGVVPDLSNG